LAIHPTLRSALLATYAAYLGPGVVTAQVRAALAVPAEPLQAAPANGVLVLPVTSGGLSRRSGW
jgi:hypothetical protein